MQKNQIKALVKLLDDPNDEIYLKIRTQMLAHPKLVLPELMSALKSSNNEVFIFRAKKIIKEINFKKTLRKFSVWRKSKDQDIFEAMLILAKYQNPSLNNKSVLNKTNTIVNDIKNETNLYLTALQQIRIINHVLFGVHKYQSDFKNIDNPNYFYINKVLKQKKGNDVSLALLYMYIAKQAGLSLYGINFPRNFLLAFVDDRKDDTSSKKDVLFYINPFNKGAIITANDINVFLKRNNIEKRKEYYNPCNSIDIMNRILKHLTSSYKKRKKTKKLNEIKKIMRIINNPNKK